MSPAKPKKPATAQSKAAIPPARQTGKPKTPAKSGQRVGVIGVGVMGQALVKGMLHGKVFDTRQLWGADRSATACHKAERDLGITVSTSCTPYLADSAIVVLCVKPNMVGSAIKGLKAAGLKPGTLVLSIAAGVTLGQIEGYLGTKNPVIRVMPNLPCVVGEGMSALARGTYATDAHMTKAHKIFQAVGRCIELDESHFNAVTGLGGSGPAYVFLVMEALADGGVRVGLPREVALQIVAQTVLGSAKMLQQTNRHPASLRDDVTTPAGCTIGALLSMEDGKIRSVLARAVEEATTIAEQLGHS